MTAVDEIVLFASTISKSCVPCKQFIQKYKLPIQVVNLDTKEDRDTAARGTYFQIVNVPTMVVMYNDNNVQTFVGNDKIIYWLTNFIKSLQQGQQHAVTQSQPHPSQHSHTQPHPSHSQSPHPSQSSYPQQSHSPQYYEDDYEDDQEEKEYVKPGPVMIEDDSEEEEPVKKKKIKGKVVNKKVNKGKKKKKGHQGVEDVELLDSEVSTPKAVATKRISGLVLNGGQDVKGKGFKSLKDTAARMAMEREQSLGYKESDLPHH